MRTLHSLTILASAAVLAFASCKKDDDGNTSPNPSNPSSDLPAANTFVSDGVTYTVEYDTVYLNKQNDSQTTRSYYFAGRNGDKKKAAGLWVVFSKPAVPATGTYPILTPGQKQTSRESFIFVEEQTIGSSGERTLVLKGDGTAALMLNSANGKLTFGVKPIDAFNEANEAQLVKVSANVIQR